jgi:hypothetical protein
MKTRHGVGLGFALTVVMGPWACESDASVFWCREDNRECFASQKECARIRGSEDDLRCFSVPRAFCFATRGGLFAEPGGRRYCTPSMEECADLWRDRHQSNPRMAIGPCVSTDED